MVICPPSPEYTATPGTLSSCGLKLKRICDCTYTTTNH
jgi:hypothetical protein